MPPSDLTWAALLTVPPGEDAGPGTETRLCGACNDEGGPWVDVHAASPYIMECFSDMVAAFRDIEEGGETLLDHMAILGSTDLSWDHSPNDFPTLVAGGACGALRTPGVHYRSPSRENASKVLLSLIRASGVEMAAFGNGGGRVTESCTDIDT